MLRHGKSSWIRHRKMSFRHCRCLARVRSVYIAGTDIKKIEADEGKVNGKKRHDITDSGSIMLASSCAPRNEERCLPSSLASLELLGSRLARLSPSLLRLYRFWTGGLEDMIAVGSLGLVQLYVLCISRCDSIELLLQIPIQVTTFSVQIPLPAPTSECGGMLIIGSRKIGHFPIMWKGTLRVEQINTNQTSRNQLKRKQKRAIVRRFIFPKQLLPCPGIISATMEHHHPDHDMGEDQQDYSFSEQNVSQEMSEEGWRALAYVQMLR